MQNLDSAILVPEIYLKKIISHACQDLWIWTLPAGLVIIAKYWKWPNCPVRWELVRYGIVYPRNGINTAQGNDDRKEHLLSQKDVCLVLANVRNKNGYKMVHVSRCQLCKHKHVNVSKSKWKLLDGSTANCYQCTVCAKITGCLLIIDDDFIYYPHL